MHARIYHKEANVLFDRTSVVRSLVVMCDNATDQEPNYEKLRFESQIEHDVFLWLSFHFHTQLGLREAFCMHLPWHIVHNFGNFCTPFLVWECDWLISPACWVSMGEVGNSWYHGEFEKVIFLAYCSQNLIASMASGVELYSVIGWCPWKEISGTVPRRFSNVCCGGTSFGPRAVVDCSY